MSEQKGTPPTASLRNRTIRTGDTSVEVRAREVRLRAVEYLYRPPHLDAPMERRLATPEQVLQAAIPDLMFQVTPDGYADMKAKAERILALWRGERF